MKRFFLLVVLPAAAIAALASRPRKAEAPGTAEGPETGEAQPTSPVSDPLGLKTLLDNVRHHFEAALQAAKEARAQTEAELHGEYKAMRKRRP